MPDIAFATYENSPHINDDDQLVASVLQQRGVSVTPVIWDALHVDWSRFDCVVIRSTWDYHLKPNLYEKWLRNLAEAGVRLWNPPEVVVGNINKKYLTKLAAYGMSVVPTAYQPAAEGLVLVELLQQRGWDDVVIKPAVSACAYGTWRTSLATSARDQAQFAEQAQSYDILIQPFVPELKAQGEWSLIFFNGQYSHAVLKRPSDDDFRVQREFGGTSAIAEPTSTVIEQARSMLTRFNNRLLYARVDGFERAGRFVLMELEINEPLLFLGYSAKAPERFAEAIIERLPNPS